MLRSLFFLALGWSSLPAVGQDATGVDQRLEAVERAFAPADPEFSYSLLGPVASKIYDGPELGPRLGLSADFFSASFGTPSTTNDPAGRHTNVVTVSPTFGYRPHRRLIFNAQVSFQNGGAEQSQTVTLRRGGAVVHFAYLDWLFGENRRAGVRLGHQLIPVGLTNTAGDARTFFGVRRPELERTLIPDDWHENGALAYYDENKVILEAGAFTSLNSRGLRGETFLNGGLSQGQNGPSDNVMGVVRLNSHDRGLLVGGSLAFGDTAQGNVAIQSGTFRLGELHLRWHRPRYELQGQILQGKLTDAGVLSALNQTVMGEVATGGMAHAAIELLGSKPLRQLWIYLRATGYNLHDRVPAPLIADPSLHRSALQLGAHYVPVPAVVLKVDVVRRRSDADAGAGHHEIWAGAGFIY